VQVPWGDIWRNKPFLAIFVAHTGWGFGQSICFTWLPGYYSSEYGVPTAESAWLSALPWLMTIVATNAGVAWADARVASGRMSRLRSRQVCQLVSCFVPAACLLYLAAAAAHQVPELPLTGAVTLLTLTVAVGGFSAAGLRQTTKTSRPSTPASCSGSRTRLRA
jgi:hypothetical protein